MDKQCGEAEGARLLVAMRKICDATGCKDVEMATLAYEEALQEKKKPWTAETTQNVVASSQYPPSHEW